ncbi:MAG: MlaD family protein [Gammaproteobacteria bacterium]|nr:MAG: MlaD family protein [Gammaproteobacteria bacterium]
MKHDNINYLVVGSFVLTLLVGLVITLAWVAETSGPVDSYTTTYKNVAGLKYGAAVTFEGFQVGQVVDISYDNSTRSPQYLVDFSVSKKIQVPDDSIAKVFSSGLLGQVSIDIKAGKSTEPFKLKDGEDRIYISGEQGSNLFTAVADAASQISNLTATQVTPLINKINTSVSKLTEQADTSIPGILSELYEFSQKVNKSADALQEILNDRNSNRIAAFLDDMDATLEKLSRVLDTSSELIIDNKDNIEQSIVDLRNSLQVVSEHIDAITFNMETTSRNMSEFSRLIRENPGLLLGGKAQKDQTSSDSKSK